jgi:hypothetical protein
MGLLHQSVGGRTAHAASWFPVASPGTVVAVCCLKAVQAHPSVRRAVIPVQVGDTVAPLTSSFHRLGFVLAQADSGEQLEEALSFARSILDVVTRPGAVLEGTGA